MPLPSPPAVVATAHPVHWSAAPGTSATLEVRPLDLSPDGDARLLVRVRFRDAAGRPTALEGGGDVAFAADHGRVQWQTRLRFDGPAAIVRVRDARPLDVTAAVNAPAGFGALHARYAVAGAHLGGVVARAIGPHRVRIGWFPAPASGTAVVERSGSDAPRTLRVAAARGTVDDDVVPGARERYVVRLPGRDVVIAAVDVPAALPASDARVVAGKGAWLAFSGASWDDDAYLRLDPGAVAARAAAAGLRYVALRLTYGEFWQIVPPARRTIDALIDALAARGIRVVAWTVPRECSAEDLGAQIAAAAYRTPAGTPIAGLAVDLERGDDFLGSGAAGREAIAGELAALRAAAGPRVLIVGTVEDPIVERLDERTFPYRRAVAAADVVQPMTYWRVVPEMRSARGAADAVAASARAVRRFAGRPIPLNIGIQTTDLGHGTAAPPPAEVAAAIRAAARAGALGVTFYDWNGTSPAQWSAIRQIPFPTRRER